MGHSRPRSVQYEEEAEVLRAQTKAQTRGSTKNRWDLA